MPLSAGERLGPYQILSPLGAGGMGEVYRAHDTRLDRDVAVKVLPEHLASDPQALARFVRETKTLAALSHPNLVVIFDTGTENGITFAVMELLEGETLRARLQRGTPSWRKVAELATAMAEGLSAAHSKGITHRDLKPENIFLTTDERVKVLDFGLARVQEHPGRTSADESTQTLAGQVMGTPSYMSPEQVRSEPAGPASDIFSLGCVLYEALFGRRAFGSGSLAETLSSILRDQPPDPGSGDVEIPELHSTVFKCLEKKPEARYQTAKDLAFHLKSILAKPAMPAQSRPIDSIAVLPFTNTSHEPDTEYLCEGITESIINSLVKIPQLHVTPRSTVFRYRSREIDPAAAGRELNVRTVLTGRVSQRADTLLVASELVDVVSGSQLWGDRLHSKVSDIFALEEEIARKISESLKVKLSGEEKSKLVKRHTDDPEAYQLYLRGRHHWVRRTPDHILKAADYFQKAIDKDPSYSLAYSGLADCFTIMGIYSIQQPRLALARAKAAAVSAVAFDDELAEAHCALGAARAYLDLDWQASYRAFERSIELNPNYWGSRYWYGVILSTSGRTEEAEEHIQHAMALEPLSPLVMHGAAWISLSARRYDEAIDRALRGLEFAPDYFLLRFWLGIAYSLVGRHAEAISELDKAVEMCAGKVSWVTGGLAHAHAVAGNRAEAQRLLQELEERVERGGVDLVSMPLVYGALGEIEKALEWFDRAIEARGMASVWALADPRFDPLRSDPRYADLLRKINLMPR